MSSAEAAFMSHDPTVTDPELYRVVFENDRVRVLEYRDRPGDRTHPHRHPDSVMVTLSAFRRRVASGGRHVDVELAPGEVRWIGAQEHMGENSGDTETHSIFVELKDAAATPVPSAEAPLGPSAA
jgi:beta-alanine degradation protein BauB